MHSNFTWTGSFPSNDTWLQKTTETLQGYPTVRPHPSAFPRLDTILECDGQTNGQTDAFAVAIALAKVAFWSAVKPFIIPNKETRINNETCTYNTCSIAKNTKTVGWTVINRMYDVVVKIYSLK